MEVLECLELLCWRNWGDVGEWERLEGLGPRCGTLRTFAVENLGWRSGVGVDGSFAVVEFWNGEELTLRGSQLLGVLESSLVLGWTN